MKKKKHSSLYVFTNATFGIIVLSFITSVFGLWSVFPGTIVGQLYLLYFVLLFAILHGEILAKTLGKLGKINTFVYSNFILMILVVIMIIPVIFLRDTVELGSFYYRVVAALGVVDATLTLIAVILHKLYIQKHPATVDNVFNYQAPMGVVTGQAMAAVPGQTMPVPPQPKHRSNIFVTILVGYIVLQVLGGLVFLVTQFIISGRH